MRSSDLGHIDGISGAFSKEMSLDVFKKMCVSRSFELATKKATDEKIIKVPVYLSLGQESIAAALAASFQKPYIFAQHRSHDLYLSYGGDPAGLVDELLSKPTGVSRGMGGSASINSPKIGMFGHTTYIGDQIPIAVGFALGKNEKTLAVFGDAAAEEDWVLSAIGYAIHKKLPILFVCIDNNLSILTEVKVRRSWKITDVVKAMGMEAVEISDDPWLVMHHVENLAKNRPALLHIHTVRELWHAGTGSDGPMEWNRFEDVKKELGRLGWAKEVEEIETSVKREVDAWWAKSLEGVTK